MISGYLDEQDRAAFRATYVFLSDRLEEASTVEWAVRLGPGNRVQRRAIENLLSGPGARKLNEPWATAWRLIEESWSESPIDTGASTSIYFIQGRLRAGDRSGSVISAIVDLVAPRLSVSPVGSSFGSLTKTPRRPKSFRDLLSAKLASGDLVNLDVLELDRIEDVAFLSAMAEALESAVTHGLDIGRRIGWDGWSRLWQLGDLYRVNYIVRGRRTADGIEDPDAYHHGIAPSVKLLFAVVAQIGAVSPARSLPFVSRWKSAASAIHVRLWAAAAKSFALIPISEVAAFLVELNDRLFWRLHAFPEIAELRAARFHQLDEATQQLLAERLTKGPPRNFWPRRTEPEKVRNGRLYWTVRELARISKFGANLPARASNVLASNLELFPDLRAMPPNEGFPEGPVVKDVIAEPDDRFDALEGLPRLRALEAALGSARSWLNDPASRADDWLRQPDRTKFVLRDLEIADIEGDEFPKILERFGWAHSPKQLQPNDAPDSLQNEADRVLALLLDQSDNTLHLAVEGISNWLGRWSQAVATSPFGYAVWFRVWPLAVRATNETGKNDADDADLGATALSPDAAREPMDLDTLNTPAGKLVGVFLTACPSLQTKPDPIDVDQNLRKMRDALMLADGRSGLIARHRLIEALPYFLRADHDWAERQLVRPLLKDDPASLALWRAIARRTRFVDTLSAIGSPIAERACDTRLGRETRGRLAFSVVVESLHAFLADRAPAIPNRRVTQMIRTLEDEVRATAANAVQQFIRDMSARSDKPADLLFRTAAAPFLQMVWPQERSLSTPGVSKAFADLPATSRAAFAEAVATIERFLVPFDCWSMLDYGLYGDEDGDRKLAMIDDGAKAKSLLRLLDLTVGTSEGAVIPYDLTDALDRISNVSPQLADTQAYRRLSTAARRL
ncbi:hypothetical protein NLM27_26655 [Bradyrhizobium sp. CCGB12]|uniref:hypothetical protein n=1 Tax=Bradyrhizobium sp. CCGB12 TaxID=2949632 RepID=UPI0020B1E61A|nr:hypothetical protein [Bradyrhizobium sp. CCGB12]MCP3392334.1 hypothetical protein [Bradyrhizobium sp. CCGB12]